MSTKNTSEVPTVAEMATEEQVGHINDLAKKHLRTLSRDDSQAIIQNGDVYQAAFRKMLDSVLEQLTNKVIRRVKVNRNRTPQQVLDATDRRQFKDDAIVATMSTGEGEEVEIVFFKLGRFVSDAELAKEYEKRGLTPDPYAQAAVNEADSTFADQHPNGTHWKLSDGGWGFLTFDRWRDERDLNVGRSDGEWGDDWWFGGVRKF